MLICNNVRVEKTGKKIQILQIYKQQSPFSGVEKYHIFSKH